MKKRMTFEQARQERATRLLNNATAHCLWGKQTAEYPVCRKPEQGDKDAAEILMRLSKEMSGKKK